MGLCITKLRRFNNKAENSEDGRNEVKTKRRTGDDQTHTFNPSSEIRQFESDEQNDILDPSHDIRSSNDELNDSTDRTEDLQEALQVAVERGMIEDVKYLIARGANVNLGRSLLRIAVSNEDTQCVRLLLENGAERKNGRLLYTILDRFTTTEKCVEILTLLLQNGANYLDFAGYAPIHEAVLHNNLDAVKVFLEFGCPLDLLTRCQNTPLTLAIYYEIPDVIRHLLQLPCNVNNRDWEGDTPLHYAAKNDDIVTTEQLLDLGASPDINNDKYITPKSNAIIFGSVGVVKVFLEYNTGLEYDNELDVFDTPMCIAVREGCLNIARMLLDAGYDASKDTWLSNSNLPDVLHSNRDLKETLLENHKNPQSLLNISRTFLRKRLGRDIIEKTKSLALPTSLKNYITLKCDRIQRNESDVGNSDLELQT